MKPSETDGVHSSMTHREGFSPPLTDEADRQRVNHTKQILDLCTHLRINVASDKEYEEATAALQVVLDHTKKQEQAIKMKRQPKSTPDFPKPDRKKPRPGENYDKQVQEESQISTSPTQGKTRENLQRRCRVDGLDWKTVEVRLTHTYTQVLAHEDEKNVPNQGRYFTTNSCTNSAFPQVMNRNDNNNDENSATNRWQNEPCKTLVGTSINIDMKCLDEFSVINLSDYSLNQTDLRLLSKGLTFTPTPDVANIGEIKSDLDRFFRKIRLRLYFSEEISEDKPSSSSSPTQTQASEFEDTLIQKFRNKSNWSPKTKMHRWKLTSKR